MPNETSQTSVAELSAKIENMSCAGGDPTATTQTEVTEAKETDNEQDDAQSEKVDELLQGSKHDLDTNMETPETEVETNNKRDDAQSEKIEDSEQESKHDLDSKLETSDAEPETDGAKSNLKLETAQEKEICGQLEATSDEATAVRKQVKELDSGWEKILGSCPQTIEEVEAIHALVVAKCDELSQLHESGEDPGIDLASETHKVLIDLKDDTSQSPEGGELVSAHDHKVESVLRELARIEMATAGLLKRLEESDDDDGADTELPHGQSSAQN